MWIAAFCHNKGVKVKIIAVIPAHLASVRLSEKMMLPIYGLPMLEHVRRRALLSKKISDVYVATCDKDSQYGKILWWECNHDCQYS